ncbi:MAG: STAS domain-containing protein [Lachnospiraceae bacterium]|nr:STAS domain-containing protein [Lachnospiraceae bacterium]
MEIIKNLDGDKFELKVEGRLDTTTAPELEEVIVAGIEGVKELVFDFEALDYISSAGLRVLLSAQKIMNKQGEMKVIGVNDTIMEIFEVTGFSDILTIDK